MHDGLASAFQKEKKRKKKSVWIVLIYPSISGEREEIDNMLWYDEMEKHTSMEDLCGTVCQHLPAYVKFVRVDDRISSILLKRGLSSQWLGHLWCRENCVSEGNNFFLLLFAVVHSLTSSPHKHDFQSNTGWIANPLCLKNLRSFSFSSLGEGLYRNNY